MINQGLLWFYVDELSVEIVLGHELVHERIGRPGLHLPVQNQIVLHGKRRTAAAYTGGHGRHASRRGSARLHGHGRCRPGRTRVAEGLTRPTARRQHIARIEQLHRMVGQERRALDEHRARRAHVVRVARGAATGRPADHVRRATIVTGRRVHEHARPGLTRGAGGRGGREHQAGQVVVAVAAATAAIGRCGAETCGRAGGTRRGQTRVREDQVRAEIGAHVAHEVNHLVVGGPLGGD